MFAISVGYSIAVPFTVRWLVCMVVCTVMRHTPYFPHWSLAVGLGDVGPPTVLLAQRNCASGFCTVNMKI